MANSAFDTWLSEKLKTLCLDEEVYGDYLKGILDEGEGIEDWKDCLCDILSGVLEYDVDETACQIITAWESKKNSDNEVSVKEVRENDDMVIKTLIEKQQTQVISNKKSDVDLDMKNKLLAQYGEIPDKEDDCGDEKGSAPSQFVNVNAKNVTDKIQQEREKSKQEHEEKRQRDKLNREKDKQKREDRLEKEKKRTQKGERRR